MASGAITQESGSTELTHNDAAEREDQVTGGEEEEEDAILEDEELFMTLSPEERDSWQKMMQERESSLKGDKEQFDRWRDRFNRRRMFAYSRARKLHETYRRRGTFYADLSVHLASVQNKGRKNSKVRLTTKIEDNGPAPSSEPQNQQQQQPQQQHHQQHQQQQQNQPRAQQQQQQQLSQLQSQQVNVSNGETVTVKPLLLSTD